MKSALLHRIQNLLITRNHLANRINKPGVREVLENVNNTLSRAVATFQRRYKVALTVN